MTLYANGDSHTHAQLLQPHQKFCSIVAQEFGLKVVNQAQGGASNERILRTTREYLATNSAPNLVLIGWSTWEREEWSYQGQYYNVNSSGHDALPSKLHDVYKNWVAEQTHETLKIKSQQWHQKIYEFHLELEQQNIQHLFFNCMYNFFEVAEPVSWNNSYLGPYNNEQSYYWWLTGQGISADQWYHFGADGHYAWAQKLINYIKEHNII